MTATVEAREHEFVPVGNPRRGKHMRTLTRTLVSATAVAGILVGSLAGASSSFAATGEAAKSAASAEAVSPLAVDNHGLSTGEARNVQCWLMDNWGYPGPLNGQLDTESWKAMQRFLQTNWGYPGPIDGVPGVSTDRALLTFLTADYGYSGPIDGIWGPRATVSFKRFAAWCAASCWPRRCGQWGDRRLPALRRVAQARRSTRLTASRDSAGGGSAAHARLN
ncbi:hypothetical protein ACWIID_00270 [Streptomyces phaeochromogenes]